MDTKHHRIYIAGDTALYSDMKLIPEMIGKIDLAVLPVGDNYTMGPKSALKAAEIVEVNKILGVHFDTFPLIKIDHEVAEELFRKSHKELILLSIGSSIKL